ncbi:hypothetical protein [Phenylobacterium sp.]|uniref:hypothetical protein n=1 Tax=Phenylobacterium sp. TaxID=1871053 RepID=UPI003960EDD3
MGAVARPAGAPVEHAECARCDRPTFVNAERVCLRCFADPAACSIDELIDAARRWPWIGAAA